LTFVLVFTGDASLPKLYGSYLDCNPDARGTRLRRCSVLHAGKCQKANCFHDEIL